MSEREYSWRKEAKSVLMEAANVLRRCADDITKDLDNEKVSEVYITLRVGCHETPSLDVQKTYIPVNVDDICNNYEDVK